MKRSVFFFLIFQFLIFYFPIKAQNTFLLKCKVIHNKKGLLFDKSFNIIINGEVVSSLDGGIYQIALNNSVTYVKVELQTTQYSVLYPIAGHLAVPKDPKETLEIVVGSPDDNKLLREYSSLIKKQNAQGDLELKRYLAIKIDSLAQQLYLLNYTKSDLEKERVLQEGRDEHYFKISRNLADFSNRASSLSNEFKNASDVAFGNSRALTALKDAVGAYNNEWNILSPQRNNYGKLISNYWQNDSLTKEYFSLVTYALDSLHAGIILPLGEDIRKINQYFQSNSKDKELKKQIQQDISDKLRLMAPMLTELQKRNDNFQKTFAK